MSSDDLNSHTNEIKSEIKGFNGKLVTPSLNIVTFLLLFYFYINELLSFLNSYLKVTIF